MLVKTDWQGKEIKAVKVPYHHGDMCLKDNRIYVAVNFGRFNDPAGNADPRSHPGGQIAAGSQYRFIRSTGGMFRQRRGFRRKNAAAAQKTEILKTLPFSIPFPIGETGFFQCGNHFIKKVLRRTCPAGNSDHAAIKHRRR